MFLEPTTAEVQSVESQLSLETKNKLEILANLDGGSVEIFNGISLFSCVAHSKAFPIVEAVLAVKDNKVIGKSIFLPVDYANYALLETTPYSLFANSNQMNILLDLSNEIKGVNPMYAFGVDSDYRSCGLGNILFALTQYLSKNQYLPHVLVGGDKTFKKSLAIALYPVDQLFHPNLQSSFYTKYATNWTRDLKTDSITIGTTLSSFQVSLLNWVFKEKI